MFHQLTQHIILIIFLIMKIHCARLLLNKTDSLNRASYRVATHICKESKIIFCQSIHRPCSKISRDLQAWILSRDELVVRLNTNGFVCKEKNREREREFRGQTASQTSLLFLSPSPPFTLVLWNQNPTFTRSNLLDEDTKKI